MMENPESNMDAVVNRYLAILEPGKVRTHRNLSVVPLFTRGDRPLKYFTLKEAIDGNFLQITEVDESGSVPALRAANSSEITVLIIEGEEVCGDKQNRVLNTTVLLKKKSKTVILVSCTEQGRWSYVSDESRDSDVVMPANIRAGKIHSVAACLSECGEFASDQGEVWSGIRRLAGRAGVESTTGAIRDVYTRRKKKLKGYQDHFPCLPGQNGLLAFVNGRVAGLDVVSRESAYSVLHEKLVRSYSMEAAVAEGGKDGKPTLTRAKAFLKEVRGCGEKKFKSVGHGWDHRYQGEGIVGSALVYRKKVIHTAFFRVEKDDDPGSVAGVRSRAGLLI